jgi:hypothetical protein
VPYGIYDLAANASWVSVGMNHDTSAFAVQTIRRWWQDIGCKLFRDSSDGRSATRSDGRLNGPKVGVSRA